MKRRWVGLTIVGFAIFALLSGAFYYTGGRGLLRIIPNYLMADIPDKRHGWGDFVPSSDTLRVSGFYAPQLSGENAVAIWTLAGLKRYYHVPDFSVYYHRDTCKLIDIVKNQDETVGIDPKQTDANLYFFDILHWQGEMQAEYPVTVLWAERDGRRVVDKLWSVSGKYKVMGLVGEGVCD